MHIDPTFFAAFRGFHALTVNNRGTRLGVTPSLNPYGLDQRFIDLQPHSLVFPTAKVTVHGLPRGEVFGQHAPLATGAHRVQNGIDNLPHFPFARASYPVFGKEAHNQHPFGILEIGRVGLREFGHSPSLPDLLKKHSLRGYPLTEEAIQTALSEICAIQLDDGVILNLDHITPIREDDEYGGYRAAILAEFESIHTPLKIDITTGDVITPDAVRYAFPSSFESKIIDVWAYNIETILAEKVETIFRRSVLNTRPRDFYDVFIITKTQHQAINREIFISALNATCKKRKSLETLQDKDRILLTIQSDPIMRQRWDRYCKENRHGSEKVNSTFTNS